VVDERNNLVHHLLQSHWESLQTNEGVEAVLQALDKQYEETRELAEMVLHQYLAVLLAVLETHEKHEPDFAALRQQLIASLPASFEYIDPTNPARTIWRNTRIVKLLKAAEEGSAKVDGMTPLASAGDYIRRQSPDLRYKEYGFAKLQDIIIASELFDVEEKPSSQGAAMTVLYKSRARD
jgi:hypothetical protein